MKQMFTICKKLKEIKGITNFNTKNVIDMSGMFTKCYELENLDLSNFDTSNVITMKEMFICNRLKEIKGLNKFNTKNVTDMSRMFLECCELEYLDLSNFNTSNVTNMNFSGIYELCIKIKEMGNQKYLIKEYKDAKIYWEQVIKYSKKFYNKYILKKEMKNINYIKFFYQIYVTFVINWRIMMVL